MFSKSFLCCCFVIRGVQKMFSYSGCDTRFEANVSSVLISDTSNLSSRDWLLGTSNDATVLALSIDVNENGLFSGDFVPPPPRPLFLDEGVASDGLTTCDLCSWAWKNGNPYFKDTNIDPPSELGWVFTLVIVSLVSAVLGAIIMITVLHCKRLKNVSNSEDVNPQPPPGRLPISTPDDKIVSSPTENFSNQPSAGVWSWLSRRSASTPSQLENPPLSFVENHYTHMEDGYNCADDALYAELDVEGVNRTAYQNSAYADPDAPSAPSSAYYSDLSVSTAPDRAYEVVGLTAMPVWESSNEIKKLSNKLDVITEGATTPSDYV